MSSLDWSANRLADAVATKAAGERNVPQEALDLANAAAAAVGNVLAKRLRLMARQTSASSATLLLAKQPKLQVAMCFRRSMVLRTDCTVVTEFVCV